MFVNVNVTISPFVDSIYSFGIKDKLFLICIDGIFPFFNLNEQEKVCIYKLYKLSFLYLPLKNIGIPKGNFSFFIFAGYIEFLSNTIPAPVSLPLYIGFKYVKPPFI